MTAEAHAAPPELAPSKRRGAWRRLAETPIGLAGAIALLGLALMALLAPWIAPYDPLAQTSLSFEPISAKHILGSDELGRDIFSRILFGLRLSLLTAVSTSLLAAIAGIAIGLVAGYFGGWLDGLAMRLMDVILSVPAILLAIVLVAIMGGGLVPLIIAIAIVAVPTFARLTRASVLTIKEREFVAAQRAAGASMPDIVLRTILPNSLGPAVVQLVITASTAVLTESGLNFLGLGVAPPNASLGSMLAAGNENLFVSPIYPVIVGFAIAILVAAFDAFGVGLQRAYGTTVSRGGVLA
ncbi:MAG TPA: ABC transporter permease [Rhizobiaceae bacterium]|nr:ABC transporter permease [Rhizobiaceae bacterium]